MRTFRLRGMAALAAVFAVAMVACSNDSTSTGAGGGSSSSTTSGGTGVCATVDTSTNDALARICKSGELRVATDSKYKPQSWYDVKTGEWKGFDVDVATEIAARLGVQAVINHQDWEVITAGSWNDRWDVSVGSMTDTVPREKLFSFTTAYYYTPAAVAVNASNTSIQDLTTDLDGKKDCVGVSTTYEDYLKKTLVLGSTAPPFEFEVDDPSIITFNTDTDALDQLAIGDGVRCDAAISAQPTIQAYIDAGGAIKLVGEPIYYEPLCVAFDKKDPVDNTSLVEAVDEIIQKMHDDDTLSSMSMDWYGADLTTSIGA
jgi:polar amino acid transport system substrate-binding protein